MADPIREGAIVELRGSKEDWQVVGQKHDGLVYKYVLQSRHTGQIKSAFAFEVFEKYTSTYFELNQLKIPFMAENDEDLAATLVDLPKVEELSAEQNEYAVFNIHDPLENHQVTGPKNEPSDVTKKSPPASPAQKDPPKKRFKSATQVEVNDLISNTNEVTTQRSTRWAVGTLKGMCHFPLLFI